MEKQINERISKLYFDKTSVSKEKRDESKARLDSIYQDINNFSNEEDRINITEKLNNILKEETSEISRIEIIDKILCSTIRHFYQNFIFFFVKKFLNCLSFLIKH